MRHSSGAARRIRSAERVILAGLLAGACAPRQIVFERAPQAYYQTAFPLLDASADLERIHRAVKRIHFSADYRTFVFTEQAGITEDRDLQSAAVLALAADTLDETDAKAGTAVILFRAGERAALVTNHHVVNQPAVRIQYFDEVVRGRRGRAAPRRVASVSIRLRERGLLADHPGLGPFELLAADSADDIALLEVSLRGTPNAPWFSPIAAVQGDPHRLSWGSFVYVLGYPRGYPMVTFAIVSDPDRDRHGGFLTNGMWNEGMSGGVVLAVRGETGRLEWVGLARAGAGAHEVRLQPRIDATTDEPDLPVLYQGPVFIESILRIQYGITFSVPMTRIQEFIARNRSLLAGRGYDLTGY